ncbi:MAG: hypothetical protein ACTHK8_13685 [Ginsengibacter sp.]
MPKKRNFVKRQLLEELKNFTNNTFTEPLNHSFQCEDLSKDIKKITGFYVSAQTIRRLYGFIKSDFYPSVKTLNVLALYNGFPNWNTFMEQIANKKFEALTLDQEAKLYLSFYQIDIKEERDMNYHNATKNIALRILSNPQLLSKLSSTLASNPVSQIYFFERFPYTDGLASPVYKRSIGLYLQKKTNEAQVFGNSMLFLSAFLCNKQAELNASYEKLMENEISEKLHPFALARFLGSNILYYQLHNKNLSEVMEQINYWNRFYQSKEKLAFWRYPYFQHLIACYLNLAGLFDESYKIIRSIRLPDEKYEIESGYKETLDVISSIARHSVASLDYRDWFLNESEKYFEGVSPLFRNFYQLQALCVYRSLVKGKKREKAEEKISRLVTQTGFVYFTDFLL